MSESETRDSPGVIAPPPLIYGGFLVLGAVLEWLWPLNVLPMPVRVAAGAGAIPLALAIAAWAGVQFRRAGTNFDVRKPAIALVISGPFRFSRNPLYLAATLLYVGIGAAADCPWILILAAPALLLMHFGVIRREERYLARRFGQKYVAYTRAVRRWL